MSRTHMNSPRYTISMSRLTATETICLHDLWICLPFIILLNIIFFFKIGLMLLWRIASTNDKWFCFVLSNSMWFFFCCSNAWQTSSIYMPIYDSMCHCTEKTIILTSAWATAAIVQQTTNNSGVHLCPFGIRVATAALRMSSKESNYTHVYEITVYLGCVFSIGGCMCAFSCTVDVRCRGIPWI